MMSCRCNAWVEEPAIMFHIANHENLLHFLNDGFLLVWQTLLETDHVPSGVARFVLPSVIALCPLMLL